MFNQKENLFNLLFEAVSEGVVVVDRNQKIVAINESTQRMFGYDKDELINQDLNLLIPSKYHHKHHSHFETFVGQSEKRQMGQGRDIYGVNKDGQVFPIETGLNPIHFKGETYVMALVIDISKRKAQELEIQKLNTELEEKVAHRTHELRDSINQLQEVNVKLKTENQKRVRAENKLKMALKQEKELGELKTKFLSMVSHEFKTPLSGILTSVMLLGKYKLTEQQLKRDKHITTITNKVHYLNNILNDFLSIERLESGKVSYNYSEFKLSKVINEVVYNSNLLLKEGQNINYPQNIDEISVYQDEKILELALSNLVHNAIKYSSERSTIDVIVNQDNNYTNIQVKDQGIGIPKADQKNIFKRYFRAENALITQGTGIGLNIVKTHLIKLGGSISFVSKENEGSTFYISIPNKAKS